MTKIQLNKFSATWALSKYGRKMVKTEPNRPP